jgi:hypothetical protein
MQISLSEYIGAKTTPTTYRLVGWRLLRVYAAAREAAIIRARKGRQRRGSWLRRRGIDAVNSPGCGDGYRSAGCQIAAEKHRWHPVPSCGGCAASRVSGARPGDSCRSKEQCADRSAALNGALPGGLLIPRVSIFRLERISSRSKGAEAIFEIEVT